MKRIVLFIALIYCFAQPAEATKYHISIAGLIGNSGTSPSASWPESKAGTYPFLPGDSVVIRRGDLLSGTITFARSGSAGNPIVIDAYGIGDNPIMDGANGGAPVITLTGSYVNINNIVAQNSAALNGNIYITSANHDINFNNLYTTGGYRGFYFKGCGAFGIANLTVLNCYFNNIGVGGSRASGSGSACQFDNCNGAGIQLAYDYAQVDMTLSGAMRDGCGDVFNFYQCNGTAASYILVHDLKVRGGGSNTGGYAGLILGDRGGSYQNAYNNKFVNSGAEGAQIQGGTHIILNNNQMYSATYSYCFEGIGFGNFSGAACNNITITNNSVNWTNGTGTYIAYFITTAGASTSTGVAGGAPLTADFTGTTSQYSHDTGMDNTLLPDPLWTGSPWNTATTTAPTLMKRKVHNL